MCFETLARRKAAETLTEVVQVVPYRIVSSKTAISDLVQLRAYIARCGVGESRTLLRMLHVSVHVRRACDEIFLWLQR